MGRVPRAEEKAVGGVKEFNTGRKNKCTMCRMEPRKDEGTDYD